MRGKALEALREQFAEWWGVDDIDVPRDPEALAEEVYRIRRDIDSTVFDAFLAEYRERLLALGLDALERAEALDFMTVGSGIGFRLYPRGFWRSGGFCVAVVAVVTPGVDWAAYIGAQPDAVGRDDLYEWVSRHGAKLSEADARHFFDCSLPYRL